MQVELYFGPMNMDPPRPEEFYSPRNELEALNFILSRIEHNSEKSKGNNASLKYLRDAIIKRVYNLGDIHKLETRLVDATCVNETLFMQWAQTYGVKSKLQIACESKTIKNMIYLLIFWKQLSSKRDLLETLFNTDGCIIYTIQILKELGEEHWQRKTLRSETLLWRFLFLLLFRKILCMNQTWYASDGGSIIDS